MTGCTHQRTLAKHLPWVLAAIGLAACRDPGPRTEALLRITLAQTDGAPGAHDQPPLSAVAEPSTAILPEQELTEPLLYAPLVPIAQPVVKWATEVNRLEDLPRILRRAANVQLHVVPGGFHPLDLLRAQEHHAARRLHGDPRVPAAVCAQLGDEPRKALLELLLVLDVGAAGAFDARWCVLPCVHRFGERWHLYYTGHEGSDLGLQSFPGIGLAVSEDGLSTARHK